MLISQQHKHLILKLNSPGRVVGVIPGAKVSKKFPGIVYVPHNPDTTAILRNIGFKKTPSPVTYEYDWPGRYTPFQHQGITVNFLTGHRRAFVLNGIGSGKTNSAAWAADYLMNKGLVKKALIISPLSTLERVWGDTIFADLFHRKCAVLHGAAPRRLKLFADPKYDFYIINPDGFPIIAEEFKKRKDINLVIADEADYWSDPSTKRFKLFKHCFETNPPDWLWMMTATPTPNAPYEAWGMARLMGTHQDISYSRFKDATMQKISQFKWIPRSDCESLVHSILSPAVRYKTSDCIDLPPCTYHTLQCELTVNQRKQLAEMKKTFAVEARGVVIDAVNEADKQNKMLQIICGFLYGTDEEGNRETLRLETAARLKVLNEILERTTEGKVIVFVPYVELITILKEELAKHGHSLEVVSGQTSANARNEIFSAFQKTEHPRILLAHPRTMSHGLTLTSAATIVWYAPYPSNRIYEQANGRINRPSQERTTNIFHLEATELERGIYERLRNRQKLQGSLLDYIKSKEM